jgi:hypothetical protein
VPSTRGLIDDPELTEGKVSSAKSIFRNFNAGIYGAGGHDSSTGWYMVVAPFVSYDFSHRYSADVSVSIYPYRYATGAGDFTELWNKLRFRWRRCGGGTLLEAHATFAPRNYRCISTAAMTLPSGDRLDGLGTGRVTFSFKERIERYFGQTGLVVDVGGGDSSGLQNGLVTEDDTALGPLGLFQAGIVSKLPHTNLSFLSVAYEQHPIGDQKTYTTLTRPGFPKLTIPTGRKLNEDNGFTTTLYIPLTSRLTMTRSYNRSLRLHLDTVSTGFTFSWKGVPPRRRESLIDRAMKEAETGGKATQ